MVMTFLQKLNIPKKKFKNFKNLNLKFKKKNKSN